MLGKLRKIRDRVAVLDRSFVRAISRQPSGAQDEFFGALSAAATNGKLWFAVAIGFALVPGKPRRAAVHGLLALGAASAVTNQVFKTLLPRARPLPEDLPVFRFVHPQPISSSFPSGHSASAVAFTMGAGMVLPTLGVALAPVAAAVAYSRVHTGAHWPSDVLLGSVLGAGAAMLTRTWWPERQATPAIYRTAAEAPALNEGDGLVIAVNVLGGSYSPETVPMLQDTFPNAQIFTIAEGEEPAVGMRRAAEQSGTRVLGAWGGDGTMGAAAAAAIECSLPLLALPGGTLNHFARDVGVASLEHAAAAASRGLAVSSDLGLVSVRHDTYDGRETLDVAMLNTASIGVYPELVRRRERLQPALGKTLSGLIAALVTLPAATPTVLEIDGVRHKLWTLYLGRGRYYPRDMAPLSRPRLDDGVFDLRMVTADGPFARIRLVGAVLTGTVGSSRISRYGEPARLKIEAVVEPFILAVDGEPIPGVRVAEFSLQRGNLCVYSLMAGEENTRIPAFMRLRDLAGLVASHRSAARRTTS